MSIFSGLGSILGGTLDNILGLTAKNVEESFTSYQNVIPYFDKNKNEVRWVNNSNSERALTLVRTNLENETMNTLTYSIDPFSHLVIPNEELLAYKNASLVLSDNNCRNDENINFEKKHFAWFCLSLAMAKILITKDFSIEFDSNSIRIATNSILTNISMQYTSPETNTTISANFTNASKENGIYTYIAKIPSDEKLKLPISNIILETDIDTHSYQNNILNFSTCVPLTKDNTPELIFNKINKIELSKNHSKS